MTAWASGQNGKRPTPTPGTGSSINKRRQLFGGFGPLSRWLGPSWINFLGSRLSPTALRRRSLILQIFEGISLVPANQF
jgi:hypothetical protein